MSFRFFFVFTDTFLEVPLKCSMLFERGLLELVCSVNRSVVVDIG